MFTPQAQSWVWGCGSLTGTECYHDGTSTEFYSKACTEFTSVCFHTLLHEVVAVFSLSLLLAVLVALVSNLAFSAPVKIICFINICSNLVWFSMWNWNLYEAYKTVGDSRPMAGYYSHLLLFVWMLHATTVTSYSLYLPSHLPLLRYLYGSCFISCTWDIFLLWYQI